MEFHYCRSKRALITLLACSLDIQIFRLCFFWNLISDFNEVVLKTLGTNLRPRLAAETSED